MHRVQDASLFRQQAYVNGQWIDGDSGFTQDVINPATNELVACVPQLSESQVHSAISAAQQALAPWQALTAKARQQILLKWHQLILQHSDDLARIMTLEQGKPLEEAQAEVNYGASFIEWFAEEAKRVYGETIPGHQADKRISVIKQAIGVTAAITPWNFP